MTTKYSKKSCYADGGEIEAGMDRAAAPTSGEKVGFFERLAAGNKDQQGSDAYNRWGGGKDANDATTKYNQEVEAKYKQESEDRLTARNKEVERLASAPAPAPAPAPSKEAGMSEKEPGWDTKESAAPAPKKSGTASKVAKVAGAALKAATAPKAPSPAPAPAAKRNDDEDRSTSRGGAAFAPAPSPDTQTASPKNFGSGNERTRTQAEVQAEAKSDLDNSPLGKLFSGKYAASKQDNDTYIAKQRDRALARSKEYASLTPAVPRKTEVASTPAAPAPAPATHVTGKRNLAPADMNDSRQSRILNFGGATSLADAMKDSTKVAKHADGGVIGRSDNDGDEPRKSHGKDRSVSGDTSGRKSYGKK